MKYLIDLYLQFCNHVAAWAPWSMFVLLGLLPILEIRLLRRKNID